MDFEAPPAVLRALKARLDHGVLGYTRPDYELKQSILKYFQEEHGLELEANSLVWLPGLVVALNVVAKMAAAKNEALTSPCVHLPSAGLTVVAHGSRRA